MSGAGVQQNELIQARRRLTIALFLQWINGFILLILGVAGLIMYFLDDIAGLAYIICVCITGFGMGIACLPNIHDRKLPVVQNTSKVRIGIGITLPLVLISLVTLILICTQGLQVISTYKTYTSRVIIIMMFVFLLPSVIINAMCAAFLAIYLQTINGKYNKPNDQQHTGRPSGGDVTGRPSGGDVTGRPSGGDVTGRPSGGDVIGRQTGDDVIFHQATSGVTNHTSEESDLVKQLRQQNRLLMEQIALQQRMLELQQHPTTSSSSAEVDPSAPPSYESIVKQAYDMMLQKQ